MADGVNSDEHETALPPPKRKPDSCLIEDAEDQPKRSKAEIETPLAEVDPSLASEVQQEGEDDSDEDEDEENCNGEVEIDRKGKGVIVTRDDKGKGKMVEEDEDDSDDEAVGVGAEDDDDDDDDSSDDDDDSGDEDDSDLSDDPLTEVDLDNILPSRTRRRAASSAGICLEKGKNN